MFKIAGWVGLLYFFIWPARSSAQIDPAVDSILREGKMLYRLETAAWNGSDLYRKYFPDLLQQTAGYITYRDGENTRCIFYSEGAPSRVLSDIIFDQTFNTFTADIDSTQRLLSTQELALANLRQKALQQMKNDTLFKSYPQATFNLIPVIENHRKRVYILTIPETDSVVLMGNDYLIEFGDDDVAKAKRAFHQGIYRFHYKPGDEVSLHNHDALSGRYITATDICILMLYERYTPWKQHVVVSSESASVWDIATEELTVMPRQVWDDIMNERARLNPLSSQ